MTFTPNHWSNKEKSKQLLDIFPYLKKKHDLGLPGDQKSLLIYDVFTGKTTENIKEHIEENDCVIVYVLLLLLLLLLLLKKYISVYHLLHIIFSKVLQHA